MKSSTPIRLRLGLLLAGTLLLTAAALGLGLRRAFAAGSQVPQEAASPLHPVFAFLDEDGMNVLESGRPVSTMQTCGQCHDAAYIEQHSFHADLGLTDLLGGGQAGGQPWDLSRGAFGKWDPLTYRRLSARGDALLDLGTPEWLMTYGLRHAGGGPAVTARNGSPLTALVPRPSDPETAILDPQTGQPVAWDWRASGVIEMNCFLCHLPEPDNQARIAAIQAGQFGWANTATLAGTGIVTRSEGGALAWNAAAFDEEGLLLPEYVAIQDPANGNCAQCHGLVHSDSQPLALTGCSLDYPQTAASGQVVSAQRISASGMNLAGKAGLTRSWDVHAERQLQCTDCHFSLNNPAYYQASAASPDHLLFDPRRLEIGEYLQRPDHNFARGQSAQFTVAPELKGTMRRCESCHDAARTHTDWLPYTERHLGALACESCHIPQMYAPAIQSYDWTVVSADGGAQTTCRGVEGDPDSLASLVSGYQPLLMQRTDIDGRTMLAPYNLVTTWFWVYDDAGGRPLPVRQADLESVYLSGSGYAPEVLTAFDADGDGRLSSPELVLDTPAKQALIAGRLEALGLGNPRIQGLIQPYSINHNVAGGGDAISDCTACHQGDSRLARPIQLSAAVPGNVLPVFALDTNVSAGGELFTDGSGALYYRTDPAADGLYVFGHSRLAWVDWAGGLFLLAVLAGVGGHGGLRAWRSLREKRARPRVRKVYMYEAYERFWHWLQTVLILVLLLTGLVIHRPDLLGLLSFRGMVVIHNVSAAVLAVNAALSLFYHLSTGRIRQFIPRPAGFFEDAIRQTRYYLRGIFERQPHPFEKTPEKKMNPLQQVTYVAILNVLLPLQGLTGILMWGAQRWPDLAARFGGLPALAPVHTLLAWLFAAFIIGHVYLTTTGGPRPLDSIKAMVTGWEDVETHATETPKRKRGKKGGS